MAEEPDIRDIREQEQNSNDGDDGGDVEGGDSGSGMIPVSMPSISKRQVAVIGLVVVAILVWKARSGDDGANTNAEEEVEKVREGDVVEGVEIDDDDVETMVPVNPDDELAKDEAAIEVLRNGGHISEAE